MRNLVAFFLTLLLLLALVGAYLVVALLPASYSRRTGWVLLGERRLGPDPDLTTIPLFAHGGKPRALQLRVLRAAAGLRALTLRFADGRAAVVELDQTLPPGAPSRVIDLPPRWPALHSLDLRYEPATGAAGEAGPLVRVYGLS